MARELGKKSQAIIDALRESDYMMSTGDLALAIGDTEEGGAMRVLALLKSMAGRGLVHSPRRGLWCDGAASHATEGQPQPVHDEPEPALAQTADARSRNRGKPGPRDATRIKVAAPKAAPLPIDAHEVAVSASGEVLVLSRDAVITRLSATVALQVAEAVRRLHQGA